MNIFRSFHNLSKCERCLWLCSLLVVAGSYLCAGPSNMFSLIASLIGVTALIFVSKGDVLGQVLTVVFSVFYAVISLTFHYYGEMITYLFMTAPIAVMSVISWLRHPFQDSRNEVEINHLPRWEVVFLFLLSGVVTFVFHHILAAFDTANLGFSTLSVTTSFLASYLTFRRSQFYALAYSANDVVLIILWVLASLDNIDYLPMIACFAMFLLNDLYGYFNWSRMQKRQAEKLAVSRS